MQQHHKSKRYERTRREKQKEEKRRRRDLSDKIAATVAPGMWVRFRDHAPMSLIGRLGYIVDWDDDGYNHRRAPRNRRVKVSIEPHSHSEDSEAEVAEDLRAGYMEPVNPLQVLAEAASE